MAGVYSPRSKKTRRVKDCRVYPNCSINVANSFDLLDEPRLCTAVSDSSNTHYGPQNILWNMNEADYWHYANDNMELLACNNNMLFKNKQRRRKSQPGQQTTSKMPTGNRQRNNMTYIDTGYEQQNLECYESPYYVPYPIQPWDYNNKKRRPREERPRRSYMDETAASRKARKYVDTPTSFLNARQQNVTRGKTNRTGKAGDSAFTTARWIENSQVLNRFTGHRSQSECESIKEKKLINKRNKKVRVPLYKSQYTQTTFHLDEPIEVQTKLGGKTTVVKQTSTKQNQTPDKIDTATIDSKETQTEESNDSSQKNVEGVNKCGAEVTSVDNISSSTGSSSEQSRKERDLNEIPLMERADIPGYLDIGFQKWIKSRERKIEEKQNRKKMAQELKAVKHVQRCRKTNKKFKYASDKSSKNSLSRGSGLNTSSGTSEKKENKSSCGPSQCTEGTKSDPPDEARSVSTATSRFEPLDLPSVSPNDICAYYFATNAERSSSDKRSEVSELSIEQHSVC